MERISVNASIDYEVLIGRFLLERSGDLIVEALLHLKNAEAKTVSGIDSNKGKKSSADSASSIGKDITVVIVSDDNVFPLYGEKLKNSLHEAGFKTLEFVFPHGEKSKSLAVYGELQEFMCDSHVRRSDIIVALGGGVTGDLAGFAAATYQRRIPFVQIPTSLLAYIILKA